MHERKRGNPRRDLRIGFTRVGTEGYHREGYFALRILSILKNPFKILNILKGFF